MKNLFDINGKVAVVTGGSRGIGAMIARGFVENGARVYITARNDQELEATAAELAELGDCIAIPGDLSTPAGLTAFADAVKRHAMSINQLVNRGLAYVQELRGLLDR